MAAALGPSLPDMGQFGGIEDGIQRLGEDVGLDGGLSYAHPHLSPWEAVSLRCQSAHPADMLFRSAGQSVNALPGDLAYRH